jgi:hypothetical protein
MLRPHPWRAAHDRESSVEVKNVGPERDRLAFKLGELCGQFGALADQGGDGNIKRALRTRRG